MEYQSLIINKDIFHLEDDNETIIGYEIAIENVFRNIDVYYFNLKHFTRNELIKLVELCTVEADGLKKLIHEYDSQLTSIKLNTIKHHETYLQKKIKFMIIQLLVNYYHLLIRSSNKKIKRMKKLKE
jgi:hypothetical protein